MKYMKLQIKSLFVTAAAVALVTGGCKKDDNNSNNNYTVPTTYSYGNNDSTQAKITLSMIAEMENLINTGNVTTTQLSATTLKGMYANTGNYFHDTTFSGVTLPLNTSGVQLSNKTFASAQIVINNILDSIATASQTVILLAHILIRIFMAQHI